MSFIAKLWGGVNTSKSYSGATTPAVLDTRNSSDLGVDRVRILLFRECEWRGRKLLFDSKVADQSRRCQVVENNNGGCSPHSSCRNVLRNNNKTHTESTSDGISCEHGKLLSEDISLLGEMIFGTVAMTYRGPSFKIHALNSPGCLMCTKVFPFAEHSVCRQSDRHSSELISGYANGDSNSSSSSLRNHSRPGSGNLSGNSLSPALRKNSTCSSTGSGWDIDVPRLSSSHSLDGSTTGLTSNGSLASLRRRWVRVMTTSLSRSEFDDSFGHNCENSSFDGSDSHPRIRHKTRLGLAMLVQLPPGHERVVSSRLFEHAALLEGMLDHLRHSCVECKGPERNLVNRLYRASTSCTLRILNVLLKLELNVPTPLAWHDLLLSSSLPAHVQVNHVYRSMQQMCHLLEEYDAKSTNFFLSTIVTAVLTHHLGWVHTAPPRSRQSVESIGNPLWAQLNDLYGTIGIPTRIAHTVIAGESEKAALIDSILNFLSYFLRSGLIEKRQESRDPSQDDVQEAIAIIERTVRKNPSLEHQSSSWSQPSLCKRAKSSTRRSKHESTNDESEVGYSLKKSKSYEESRKSLKFEVGDDDSDSSNRNKLECEPSLKPKTIEPVSVDETSSKKLKRSSTLQKSLNEFSTSTSNAEVLEKKEPDQEQTTSKVKIIVSDEDEQKIDKESTFLQEVEKTDQKEKVDNENEEKLTELRRKKLGGLKRFDWNLKNFEDPSGWTPNFADGLSQDVKTQVYFTLGGEEKSKLSIRERLKSACKCQCSYTFTRVPSTSAELPEGVLRKILQRNFPESSKNIMSSSCESEFGVCMKCHRGNQSFDSKLMLETPTNATEVLKGCNSTARSTRMFRSNSLEALIEANCVIELPMPRSKKIPPLLRNKPNERVGFSKSLLGSKTVTPEENLIDPESGFSYGMVVQGFTKKKKKGRRKINGKTDVTGSIIIEETPKIKENENWWWPIREALSVEAKFPLIDQPVSEVLCILGDLDNWQVGLLSSNTGGPIPVGMSSLVSNMLEAFVYMWKEIRSPEQCVKLLESRLREMWLRSETLAEFLLAADLDDASVGNLTSFLDVDAADLPLLLAVATTHTPQIAQRFGLTLA